MRKEDEASITQGERTTADGTDPVSDDRAEIAANGSGSGDEQQAREGVAASEAPGGDEVSGKRKNDFRRKRDTGRFDSHEQENAEIAGDGDRRYNEVHQTGENLFGHNTLSIKVRPRRTILRREET